MNPPVLERHGRFLVVRDDLLPGGTKQRCLYALAEGAKEVCYAGPAWGGAQVAIALVAAEMGIKATLFFAARKELSPRQRLVKQRYGAVIQQIRPGYLTVVRARCRDYAAETGARVLDWGLPSMVKSLAEIVRSVDPGDATEVWVSAGSGTVLRALAKGLAPLPIIGVQVGHALTLEESAGCRIISHPLKFEQRCKVKPPFPSCAHYDAKAWEVARGMAKGRPLFWNVMQDHF